MGNWTILINTQGTHFKFWSYEKINGLYSGNIRYGRIGTRGTSYRYNDISVIRLKIREKIREGYSTYVYNTSTPLLNLTVCNRLMRERNNQTGERTIPEPVPAQTQPRPVRRTTQQAHNINFSSKTSRTGYIKNVRYERPNIQASHSINFNFKFVRDLTTRQKHSFLHFFQAIPASSRNNISSYGDSETPNTMRWSRGETFFAFYRRSRVVGVASINRSIGKCSILYVKSSIRNKRILLKYILKIMSTNTGSSKITFHNINHNIKTEIKNILNVTELRDISTPSIISKTSEEGNIQYKRIINRW